MEQGTVFSAGLDLIPGLDREALRHKLDSRRGLGLRSDLAIAKALGADDLSRPKGGDTRPAAVLVPLVMRPQGATVMLTRRTAHLNNHAGQISFPGLSPQRVEVLGTLDDYITITGFRVVPVVALVHPPFDLAPDAFEVDEVFEVPLAFLLDPANHQKVARTINGRLRPYYAIPYQDYYIWGATAGMLMNLYAVVSDLAPES
jgi:8-oxo-dGTP pyrophosphatase MutT (NUDIX family)